MKQFSLDEFKKNPNRKVVTRGGRNVRIICTDAKGYYPVIGLILSLDNEDYPWRFRMDGAILENEENESDLFFAPEKKEGWANIYKNYRTSNIYKSKEDAFNNRAPNYIASIPIEWEE